MSRPIALLSMGFVIVFSGIALTATLQVPADYPTFRAGIDAASNGDTVLVADCILTAGGNHNPDLSVKPTEVISGNGAGVTIIDCGGSRSVPLGEFDPHLGGAHSPGINALRFRPRLKSGFVKTIGGTLGDYGNAISTTSDGGYIITGVSTSFSGGIIAKFTPGWDLEWARSVSGVSGGWEGVGSVLETPDKGYAALWLTGSYGAGFYDALLVKFDSLGNFLWAKTFGGADWDQVGPGLIQTQDGGLAFTGWTESFGVGGQDLYIVKVDSLGNLEWARVLGGGNHDGGSGLKQTSDGGYVIAGWTFTYGVGIVNCLVVKFDSSGNYLWSKTIGGSVIEQAYSVIETSDGGYAIAGQAYSYGAGSYDVLFTKLDTNGNYEWFKTIGGTEWDDVFHANCIVQAPDGGYVIAGSTESYGGTIEIFLVSLAENGSLEWAKTVGGADWDYPFGLIETHNGGYAVVGDTRSYGYVTKIIFAAFGAEGNSCIGGDVSPIVTSPHPVVTSPSPSVSSFSPTITSPSPTITFISPVVDTICESVHIDRRTPSQGP